MKGMRVHPPVPSNEQSADDWRFSRTASIERRRYLQKKYQSLIEEQKQQIREGIDRGAGVVYKLAVEFRSRPKPSRRNQNGTVQWNRPNEKTNQKFQAT